MSGKQFVETLQELKYPKAKSLDSQSFDWMFESDARPFLNWFCTNVSPSNILTPDEIKQFKSLQKSGEGILDGRQLDEALNIVSSDSDEDLNEEALKDDISRLASDLEAYKKRKQTLLQRRNKLSMHHTKLSHRLAKLSAVESQAKHDYREKLVQCQGDNTEMNRCLENLVETVNSLSSAYDLPMKTSSGTNKNPTFLSQLPLNDYYDAQDKFTQELTKFTKKQFFEGFAEMAGHDEGSRYQILDISDPNSLLIRGEREDVYISNAEELARLHAVYPKSESQWINAVVKDRRTTAAFQEAQDILNQIKSGNYGKNIKQLSENMKDVQSALLAVKKDLTELTDYQIGNLIKENAASQINEVLTGDYNLKIARQHYFTSNQDQVIDQLLDQLSRNEFLTMAYEVEARNHRDVHRLLTAIKLQLQSHLAGFQSRMDMMCDPSLAPSKQQRNTIDSRDKSTIRIHQMLSEKVNPRDKQLFLTYSGLAEGAERLHVELHSAEETLIKERVKQEEKLKTLEQSIKMCKSKVYAGSSTTTGQPLLMPLQLKEAMLQLEDTTKKIEQAILDIVKDIDNKKKTLKNSPLLIEERKLLVNFFNNPSKVRESVEQLSSRLQSQRIK